MANSAMDFHELDDLSRDMLDRMQKLMPNSYKAMLKKMQNKTIQELKREYKKDTEQHTGDLIREIKKGKPYKHENSIQARVLNYSPHAHLIEYGHWNIKTKKSKNSKGKIPFGSPVQMVPGKDGPIFIEGKKKKFTPGRHSMEEAKEKVTSACLDIASKELDKAIDRGLGL